jgi:hypothetical protein
MSRIVIVISIYHRHKPVDFILGYMLQTLTRGHKKGYSLKAWKTDDDDNDVEIKSPYSLAVFHCVRQTGAVTELFTQIVIVLCVRCCIKIRLRVYTIPKTTSTG